MTLLNKRLGWNLLLLLLVVALAGLAWWQAHRPAAPQPRLLNLSRAEVQQVIITRQPDTAQQSVLHLQRAGERWRITAPRQLATNPAKISQLFTLLDETVSASYPAEGKDLAQYGLQPPALKVQFNDSTLLLGAENPVSRQRYFLRDGQLMLASEAVYGLLNSDVLNWVSNRLLPEERAVKAVHVPEGLSVKRDLDYWQSLSALRVEDWDGKDAGKGKITLTLDDNSEVELVVLSLGEEWVVGNPALQLRYVLPNLP